MFKKIPYIFYLILIILFSKGGHATTFHTLPFDGSNAFSSDESFDTSTDGYNAYITWDDTFIYLAYTGPKIGSSNDTLRSDQFMYWYFDVDPHHNPKAGKGTDRAANLNTQITPPDMWPYVWYDTQSWNLPFNADYRLMINLPGDTIYSDYDAEEDIWHDYSLDHIHCNADTTIDYVEVRVPRSLFGDPTEMYIVGWIASSEWDGPLEGDYFSHTRDVIGSYASWPANSLEGGDGDHHEEGKLTTFYRWELINGVQPNVQNGQPIALNDTTDTIEDTEISINVLANDSEEDGETLSIGNITEPANGRAQRDGTSIIYTPDADFFGTDTFTYIASDDKGGFDRGIVHITVDAVNDPPVAVDDSTSTPTNTEATIDVLANDSDVENEPLSITTVFSPEHGSVINNTDNITYTPDSDYHGWDYFEYEVSDTSDNKDTALVTIAVNDAPMANNDTTTTEEDTSVDIAVLINDNDPNDDSLSIHSVLAAEHGSTSFTDSIITYTPDVNFNGADSFRYVIQEAFNGRDTAWVHMSVSGINDPPVAADDHVTTDEDSVTSIDVLSNDSDPDNDPLAIQSAIDGKHGTVVIEGDSILVYTPEENYFGEDTLSYVIEDPSSAKDTGYVFLEINAVNDPPEIVDLPEELFMETNDSTKLNMSEHQYDVDSPDSTLMWSFTVNDSNAIHYSYNDSTDTLTIFTADTSGDFELYATLEDDSGATDQDTIIIHVSLPSNLMNAGIELPKQFQLSQNYPNPFNPVTTIPYALPKASEVKIILYDVTGRRIKNLFQGNKPAGYHHIRLDASQLASGLYFYRMEAGNFSKVMKLMVMK
ncbi:MAG: tandem-95 repeat protein [Caldithrix sp.]|nr:tandem-95 repeat protein [Caldithrix sp.]